METRIPTVMSQSQRDDLIQHLSLENIEVLEAVSCLQARGLMKAHVSIQVVLAARELPDGYWRTVLADMSAHDIHVAMIVCIDGATIGFWCEVLEQGAYDLLLEPYKREEVQALVE